MLYIYRIFFYLYESLRVFLHVIKPNYIILGASPVIPNYVEIFQSLKDPKEIESTDCKVIEEAIAVYDKY